MSLEGGREGREGGDGSGGEGRGGEGRGGEGRGGEGHIKTNIERELQKLLAKATYFVNTEVTRKRRACASHKTGGRSQTTLAGIAAWRLCRYLTWTQSVPDTQIKP